MGVGLGWAGIMGSIVHGRNEYESILHWLASNLLWRTSWPGVGGGRFRPRAGSVWLMHRVQVMSQVSVTRARI